MSKIVIGNWKMNGLKSSVATFRKIVRGYSPERAAKARLALCPPATLLAEFAMLAAEKRCEKNLAKNPENNPENNPSVLLGGQSCHFEPAGSFTGSVSAAMLHDAGASLTLVGHAERRAQGEDDEQINAQLLQALEANLTPVLCVGERQAERAQRQEHLERQLTRALASLPPSLARVSHLIVAYEPVWAIGSGTMPSTAEIEAVCRKIAEQTRSLVPSTTRLEVLYGGSVTPANAAEIVAATDGVLVGSASLEAENLLAIVDAA